ncbi:MAG: hypothetical protein O3A10_08560 [Chloroflexi bacterium]|nr:hypothetical protein [Chloroflexota bacterium]MDA1146535.1 hypothetical protein [Chloroflexota bacterium]MQC82775.1 hypothetical protein [Chloroflexota bacterium]PKB56739.1 MAG: hypothetical protein BZY69_00030 [SAR202 cluster bacterium Casp-Chloro-G1]
MKVEFTAEEVNAMLDAIVDEIVELSLDRSDKAAIRRWRTDTAPGTAAMALLTEKLNTELQREFGRSEVSAIKKPDWAT